MYVQPPGTTGRGQQTVSRQQAARKTRLALIITMAVVGLAVPFFVYAQLNSVLDSKSRAFFIYHPVLMTIAAMAILLPAILQRRMFGYVGNKVHMYSMLTVVCCVLAGAFVIIRNKQITGDAHFQTLHSRLGLIFIIISFLLATPGLLALDPDHRLAIFRPDRGIANLKRYIYVRRLHTWTGRLEACLGYLTVYLGWIKFFGPTTDFLRWASMTALLLLMTGMILIDPINDFLGYRKGVLRNELQEIRGG